MDISQGVFDIFQHHLREKKPPEGLGSQCLLWRVRVRRVWPKGWPSAMEFLSILLARFKDQKQFIKGKSPSLCQSFCRLVKSSENSTSFGLITWNVSRVNSIHFSKYINLGSQGKTFQHFQTSQKHNTVYSPLPSKKPSVRYNEVESLLSLYRSISLGCGPVAVGRAQVDNPQVHARSLLMEIYFVSSKKLEHLCFCLDSNWFLAFCLGNILCFESNGLFNR